MQTINTVAEMQQISRHEHRNGAKIGFVPTMGFLHEGHLSLMHLAREQADVLVVSIFVNPTQFGPNEDLDRYPRDFERDSALCQECGVDYIFFPPVAEMYAPDASVYIDETEVSTGLCGAFREGHFRGVLTVVAKLFNMVQPDFAVFGQKDAQQAAVIKRMVRDLNFPLEVIVAPIVREPDGLAMSSRNTFLSDAERQQALSLNRALSLAEKLYAGGITDCKEIEAAMRAQIEESAPDMRIQYIEFVDAESIQPLKQARHGTLIALAAHVGKTRLIDNLVLVDQE